MPLQDAIPDTSSYLVAGYISFAVIFAIYLASFLIRRRNLEQDLKTLETLRAEQASSAPKQAGPARAGASRKPSKPVPGRAKPSPKRAARKR